MQIYNKRIKDGSFLLYSQRKLIMLSGAEKVSRFTWLGPSTAKEYLVKWGYACYLRFMFTHKWLNAVGGVINQRVSADTFQTGHSRPIWAPQAGIHVARPVLLLATSS